MIAGRKILAVITARGGSKGVPRKNIRMVGGKPLIAWTIEAAKASRHLDRVVLSSEDDEIIAVARSHGCEVPFVRPVSLAQDETPGVDPVLHALDELPGYDVVVLLQPTSPLRIGEDIDGCVALFATSGADACVSVAPAEQSPYWMFRLGEGGRMLPLMPDGPDGRRRQDLPPVWVLNGAVYVADCAFLRRERGFLGGRLVGYPMPLDRSLDIDSERDLDMVEARCLEANVGNPHQTIQD